MSEHMGVAATTGPARHQPDRLWLRRDLVLRVGLQNRLPALAGADANRLLHRQDEDLAVADLAGAGVLEDRLDDDALVLVLDHDLELQLGSHADGQGRAAVVLDQALLST